MMTTLLSNIMTLADDLGLDEREHLSRHLDPKISMTIRVLDMSRTETKVNLIKFIRACTGMGLRDSKNVADNLTNGTMSLSTRRSTLEQWKHLLDQRPEVTYTCSVVPHFLEA